jgi:hypothetical protein
LSAPVDLTSSGDDLGAAGRLVTDAVNRLTNTLSARLVTIDQTIADGFAGILGALNSAAKSAQQVAGRNTVKTFAAMAQGQDEPTVRNMMVPKRSAFINFKILFWY